MAQIHQLPVSDRRAPRARPSGFGVTGGISAALVELHAASDVIGGRVGFQTDNDDEFTAAVERLTHRHVVAFLSADQTAPGVAGELSLLDAPVLADAFERAR